MTAMESWKRMESMAPMSRFADFTPGMGSVIMAIACTGAITPRPVSEIWSSSRPAYVSLLNEVEGSGPISGLQLFEVARVDPDSQQLLDFLDYPEKLQASGRIVARARRAAPTDFHWSL